MINSKEIQNILLANPHLFKTQSSKIVPFKRQYPELDWFRCQLNMETGHHAHNEIYAAHKKSSKLYRNIFMGWGVFFLVLLLFIGVQSSMHFYRHLEYSFTVTSILLGLCSLLSSVAFLLGYRIRPEREVVHHLFRKAKKHLSNAQIGTEHVYHEVIEKVHDVKRSTLLLVDHIVNAYHLDGAQKDRLCNQAIMEFRDKLKALTNVAL